MTEQVTINELGAGGDGVGEINGHPVYVPYAAPGDILSVEEVEKRGNGTLAKIDEILTPSPVRAKPECRHFETCGGCQLQHLNDEFLAEWKKDIIQKAMATRDVGTVNYQPTVTSPARTRRRVEFIASKRKKGVMIGYHLPKSHQIFDVGECPLLMPELQALVKPLRQMLPDILPRNSQARLTLTVTENGPDILLRTAFSPDLEHREILASFAHANGLARICWYDDKEKLLEQIAAIKPATVKVGAQFTTMPPGGFLQATECGQDALINLMLPHIDKKSEIVDLFAGCGTFSLPAAAAGKTVHAVEGSQEHTDMLKQAANQQILPVTTDNRDLFRRPLLAEELKKFNVAIIDPPRAGAAAQVQELAYSSVEKIIFISCNPKSFAREAEALLDAGFKMGDVTPVDQFRWSTHVELFCVFEKIAV